MIDVKTAGYVTVTLNNNWGRKHFVFLLLLIS